MTFSEFTWSYPFDQFPVFHGYNKPMQCPRRNKTRTTRAYIILHDNLNQKQTLKSCTLIHISHNLTETPAVDVQSLGIYRIYNTFFSTHEWNFLPTGSYCCVFPRKSGGRCCLLAARRFLRSLTSAISSSSRLSNVARCRSIDGSVRIKR